MSIKLVAIDIDGTLLNSKKEITPEERVRMARSFILNPEQNKGEVTGK